jgi:hypothetical protein
MLREQDLIVNTAANRHTTKRTANRADLATVFSALPCATSHTPHAMRGVLTPPAFLC